MKCNTPKPQKLPKSFYRLPQYEQDALNKAMSDKVYDEVDEIFADFQETWIKLGCVILHDRHAMDEEELLQFIADWKHIYRKNERIKTEAEQKAWLDSEMKRCFPECGFPQIRIDEMRGDKR